MRLAGFSTKPLASSKASTDGAKAKRRFPSRSSSNTNGGWGKGKALPSTRPSDTATPTVMAASPSWRPASSPNTLRNSQDHSEIPVCLLAFAGRSELRVAGRSRKGDDIADVRNAGEKHKQPFEAEAEARVRHGAVSSQVRIPPIVLRLELVEFKVLHQLVPAFFPLPAANDLANPRHKYIHGGHGFGVIIHT